MKSVKYILIGGGLASCEAVKGIRKHDQVGSIALVGLEAHLPYNRPPLSKAFLQGEKSRDECFCEDSAFYRDQKVETFLGCRAEVLDAEQKVVTMDNGDELQFDKCLLATGGDPISLPVNGIGLGNVFLLRTIDDSIAIQAAAKRSRKAVVIGAGFIGMEITASLTAMGLDVTVIEAQDRLWSRFADPQLAGLLKDYYEKKGVTVLTDEKVNEIRGPGKAEMVATESGKEIACDFVVCAAGIKPNIGLAEDAGLEIDNGVVVNQKLQTSHPDIFAAGDIANFPDPYFDKRRRVEHWGQAEYTGGVAGENMAGADQDYDLLTYVWSEGFDLHFEFAGEEAVYDKVILRGQFPENNFAALYLMANRLRGFVAINPDDEVLNALEALVNSQQDLSDHEETLAQAGRDLTGLLDNSGA